jgi:TetR/AcrR family transcriptional regulator, mexJK operon transcriptional repressor
MDAVRETRSQRKHGDIMRAATAAFIAKGYEGASMDEIAANAGVSKQTLYKHFADKDRLFEEIVLATAGGVDRIVVLAGAPLAESNDVAGDLKALARAMLSTLMDEELLKLRRLVISSAGRAPKLGRAWYEQGFERVLTTLAGAFKRLSERGLLAPHDPLVAANHFVGMLLWIPLNEAMFTGEMNYRSSRQRNSMADVASEAFLRAYGPERR